MGLGTLLTDWSRSITNESLAISVIRRFVGVVGALTAVPGRFTRDLGQGDAAATALLASIAKRFT